MKFLKNSIFFVLFSAFLGVAVSAQETGGVKGKVRTARGEGISGVTITFRQNGEDVKSIVSGSGGKFELNNLEIGLYNVVFTRDGFSSGLKYNVEIKKGKISDLGDRLILTVDQGAQVIIKGSVFDKNGRSIAGIKVDIEKVLADGSVKKAGSGYTSDGSDAGVRGGDGNSRGDFTFRFNGGAAKYRVTASTKDLSASKEIEVDSPAIYRLALTLDVKN